MEPFKYNPLPSTLARDFFFFKISRGDGVPCPFFNRQFVKNLWSIRELSIKVVQ